MTRQVVARSVVVHGLVQGVGFRWSALNAATDLGLTGWVSNEFDGTVRCLVQGAPERVARMLTWLEHGPRYAQVTDVEVAEVEPERMRSFEVRG
ncbi:acylphosphatase [Propionicicella superfundia]|uniref:acylphosphatase n=1 Tax=Propionicicella superfundia TaxID=348582 RepID=UPI000407CF09|nr:acylphosphatase [Propionicicella superfundia]